MCGIAGIYSPIGFDQPSSEQACLNMLGALTRRGPDAQGIYQNSRVILGHRRLSIIDFSENARQPLSNEDGTIWLSYNGEIYNHRELKKNLLAKGHSFRSETDSEVIVHLYEEHGGDCLRFLRGMFAFALWDETKRELLLARDRFGIKPLYYAVSGRQVVFASETKAIIASGLVSPELSMGSATRFLKFGSVPAPNTIYKAVQCLPAGHTLSFGEKGTAIRAYWDLGSMLHASNQPVILEDLDSLFRETVKQHLLSDAPLGIMLSGGLDSSSLVAMAALDHGEQIKTFTVSFPGMEGDESRFAKEVSGHFRTEHHEYAASGNEIKTLLPSFIRTMDQPTMDGLNTFVTAKAAKEAGIRVLLSGLGGDEIFLGYTHLHHAHSLFRMLAWCRHMPPGLGQLTLRALALGGRVSKRYGAERIGYLSGGLPQNVYEVCRGIFSLTAIQRLTGLDAGTINAATIESGLSQDAPPLNQAVYFEFQHYLHDQLLRDADVFGMSHSVEIRVPFLDHEIASRVLPHSISKHIGPGHKQLLKMMMKTRLPKATLERPKRGFTFPMTSWMRTHLREEIEEVLMDSGLCGSGVSFQRKESERLWGKFLNGKVHWSLPWTLFVLKSWLNRPVLVEKIKASLTR